jgi:kynurenine formamidase
MPFQHKLFNWFEERPDQLTPVHALHGPYHTRWLLMDEHTGTHFDAPSHSLPPLPDSPRPADTDGVSLGVLLGPAAVVDVSDLSGIGPPGSSFRFGIERIEEFERLHGALRPDDIVLLRTDWDARYKPGAAGADYVQRCAIDRSTPAWAAPTPELFAGLAERGTRCVGIDAPSIAPPDDPGPVHRAGLERGVVYVEGLARLRLLPPRGSTFVFLPLALRGGSGAPGRAISLLPEEA